jgi:hypothetical protein
MPILVSHNATVELVDPNDVVQGWGFAQDDPAGGAGIQRWILSSGYSAPPGASVLFRPDAAAQYTSTVDFADAKWPGNGAGARYVKANYKTYGYIPSASEYPMFPVTIASDRGDDPAGAARDVVDEGLARGIRLRGTLGNLPIDVVASRHEDPSARGSVEKLQFDLGPSLVLQGVHAARVWVELRSSIPFRKTWEHFAFGPGFTNADVSPASAHADPTAPGSLAAWQQSLLDATGALPPGTIYGVVSCTYFTSRPSSP